MTGYGSAEGVDGGVRVVAELRSVNNRFAEISVKLPRQLSSYELDVRDLIRAHFQRGKITAFIQIQEDAAEALPLKVNEEKVRAYKALLEQVRECAGLESPVVLNQLLKYSDIFDTEDRIGDKTEEIWGYTRRIIEEAIVELKKMRQREGAELVHDFMQRITDIGATLDEVQMLSTENMEVVRQRLRDKVAAVAEADITYSRDRLETELVLVADKLDITEECTRFRSHNKFFLQELENDEPGSGRKLNFLLQEQLREANTIASKSQHAEIAHKVVGIKEELEKIREQLQNIE